MLPVGWWHAVWNVEDTVAVTENTVAWKDFRPVLVRFSERLFEQEKSASAAETSADTSAETSVETSAETAGGIHTEAEASDADEAASAAVAGAATAAAAVGAAAGAAVVGGAGETGGTGGEAARAAALARSVADTFCLRDEEVAWEWLCRIRRWLETRGMEVPRALDAFDTVYGF